MMSYGALMAVGVVLSAMTRHPRAAIAAAPCYDYATGVADHVLGPWWLRAGIAAGSIQQ